MEKISFTETINAPASKVWDVLWADATYRQWTSPFSEGSYAVTDWKEGSKVQFLAPGGNGMYSMIEVNKPNEYMSIKHLGEIKDGKEMPPDEKTQQWSGAHENYRLTEKNGITELQVELDAVPEFAGFFNEAFPKAFKIVKKLAEA